MNYNNPTVRFQCIASQTGIPQVFQYFLLSLYNNKITEKREVFTFNILYTDMAIYIFDIVL
jgi:hypothetical protein